MHGWMDKRAKSVKIMNTAEKRKWPHIRKSRVETPPETPDNEEFEARAVRPQTWKCQKARKERAIPVPKSPNAGGKGIELFQFSKQLEPKPFDVNKILRVQQ